MDFISRNIKDKQGLYTYVLKDKQLFYIKGKRRIKYLRIQKDKIKRINNDYKSKDKQGSYVEELTRIIF